MHLTSENKEIIKTLCETHHVEKLYLFGSATTTKFNEESDLDFLVKFKSFDLKLYFLNYIDLKNKLKNLLHREIDLVEEQTLKNPYLIRSIEETKELIYPIATPQ
ncbi:nucleotidyltransferase family protein [Flavobacterium sp. ZS1P14]|uniref:nucleotidyltransferase family protein n=1 Tax=Flavobacterium sp. ZS1P14 TaxID=3401729 RepID=UPI003AADB3F4